MATLPNIMQWAGPEQILQKVLVDLVDVGPFAVQMFGQQLRIGSHPLQVLAGFRIARFSQLRQRKHAHVARGQQLPLGRFEIGFGQLPPSDVHHGAFIAANLSLLVEDGPRVLGNPDDAAILAADFRFEVRNEPLPLDQFFELIAAVFPHIELRRISFNSVINC